MAAFIIPEKGETARHVKWLFVLSATSLAALLSMKGELIWIAVSLPLVAAVLWYLTFRVRFLEKTFSSLVRWQAGLSLVLAAYGAHSYAWLFYSRLGGVAAEFPNRSFLHLLDRFGPALAYAAGILSVFALFVYFCWFFNWFSGLIRARLHSSDVLERRFLLVATAGAAILIVAVYCRTVLFHSPNANAANVWSKVDILYSSDTSSLVDQNVFFNVYASENDVRQPFFGIFAAPFALTASLCARLLRLPVVYCVLLQIMQAGLLFLSLVLTARMIRAAGLEKALFLLTASATFPVLLFLLNMEQYIFPLFWTVLLVWQYVAHDSGSRHMTWVAASGSMLTSGVLITLVSPARAIKERTRGTLRSFAAFGVVALLFGRVPMFLSSAASVRFFMQFVGKSVPFFNRLMQYAAFVASCFVAPAAEIIHYSARMVVFQQTAVTQWSVPGLILLLCALAGFVVNRKNAYARICIGWVGLSFLLLCVIGWGTAENGLVLYNLYFSWAFVSLIAMLIRQLFRRKAMLKYAALIVGFLLLMICNITGIAEIVRFGIAFYPA